MLEPIAQGDVISAQAEIHARCFFGTVANYDRLARMPAGAGMTVLASFGRLPLARLA